MRSTIITMLLSVAWTSTPAGADDGSTTALMVRLQDAIRELGDDARARLDPPAAGETGPLRAAVMEVQGQAEWRADQTSAWKAAKVDDLLGPGAAIRTGRQSMMSIRVGHNATVLVSSHTRLALPRVLREGQTLKTVIEVTRGRADFKVDRVGLTNDFSVVTPSTTLSVRGTGFAVDYGGLEGTRIMSARFNEMASIEVRYFLSKFAYALSARVASTEAHPNPAVAGLFKSFGPPRLVSAVLESDATPELLMASLANPVRRERQNDLAVMGVEQTEEELFPFAPPFGFIDDEVTFAEIAMFICDFLMQVIDRYSMLLNLDGLGDDGLPFAHMQIAQICLDAHGEFEDGDLNEIVQVITSYCQSQHAPSQQAVQKCVEDFYKAVFDTHLANPPEPPDPREPPPQ